MKSFAFAICQKTFSSNKLSVVIQVENYPELLSGSKFTRDSFVCFCKKGALNHEVLSR